MTDNERDALILAENALSLYGRTGHIPAFSVVEALNALRAALKSSDATGGSEK